MALPIPFLLKRCDLAGCNRQAVWLTSSMQYLCGLHYRLGAQGKRIAEKIQQKNEETYSDLAAELEQSILPPGDEEPKQ